MADKYFEWISDGYYKPGGVLYAPKEIRSQIAKDGEEVQYKDVIFTLKRRYLYAISLWCWWSKFGR